MTNDKELVLIDLYNQAETGERTALMEWSVKQHVASQGLTGTLYRRVKVVSTDAKPDPGKILMYVVLDE